VTGIVFARSRNRMRRTLAYFLEKLQSLCGKIPAFMLRLSNAP
jgi:hypothetical protein